MNIEIGEPEAVLNRRSLTDYNGVYKSYNNQFYIPPVDQGALSKLRNANAHHGAAIAFKRNMLMKYFEPTPYMNYKEFKKLAMDWLIFGHAYQRVFTNRLGRLTRVGHLPGLNMRRLVDDNERYGMIKSYKDVHKFDVGDVLQIKEYDPQQSFYGVPEYFPGLQALLLNEAATLFRRKYYENGAHAGYVFYTTDPNMDETDEEKLKESIANSKGIGNFRSIYLNIPNGSPDGVKLIPVGDISTKDEFERIKNISRNDIIAVHRMNPALAGIMPENNGGFGDIEKIDRVYHSNEIIPLQQPFLEINEMLGIEVIKFRPMESV